MGTALPKASTTKAMTPTAATPLTHRQPNTSSTMTQTSNTASNSMDSSTATATSNTSSRATISNRASTASLVRQAALQMVSVALVPHS